MFGKHIMNSLRLMSHKISFGSTAGHRLQMIRPNPALFKAQDFPISSQSYTVATFATQSKQAVVEPQQYKLPRLPVPPLNDTLAKYLRSVKPLLSDEDFKKTTEVVKEFGTNPNLGPKLQSLLENRANSMDNWMSDWWLITAYLEYRSPVVVHSSPGLVLPLQNFKTVEEQLSYATKMIHGAILYKDSIDNGQIKPDMMGKIPLDMSQYDKIFGTTRNPASGRDILVYNPKSRHIIVAFKNYFHKVSVYDAKGKILDPLEIYKQLKYLVDDTSGLSGIPLGYLTSEHRDTWANSYERLKRDPVNKQSLKTIEESLFVLSIDRPNRWFSLPKEDNPAAPGVEDVEYSQRQTITALQMVHGNRTNSGNRWFDKTIGFVVGTEGGVGLTYEHSPADGPPIANMMDYIVEYMTNNSCPFDINANDLKPAQPPVLLQFNLKDKKINKAIADAKDSLDSLIQDLDMSCFTFKTYGREFIKSCKMSPDSFIQMAIQAAFYKVHSIPAAHYESASVRMFIGGRTETIRSCSIDSLELSKALLDTSLTLPEKLKLMKKAVESHKNYASDAIKAHGVDRHLLGLKKIAIENGMDVPELFLDEGYAQSTNYRLSTSQVSSKFEAFMCYGPVVPNGYGTCYNPLGDKIVFGISAFNTSPETNAVQFKKALQETLLDMQKIGSASTLQSKL